MSYDPGRCFWCENMQCDYCNGINEWNNPHASETIGQPCKCYGHHPYKLRPKADPVVEYFGSLQVHQPVRPRPASKPQGNTK